jgi:GAF domain-containing protein/tetratricopeptide (TPR) repeat protein
MTSNTKKRIEKAQRYLQRGRVQEALEEYRSICQDDPSDMDVLRTLADLLEQAGDVKGAVLAFQTLIGHAKAEGTFNKALVYHRKIIRLMPNDPEKVLELAQYLVHNNRIPDAVQEYLKAVEIFVRQNTRHLALQCYERILELCPEETKYREMMGEFAFNTKKDSTAERCFIEAGKQHLSRRNMAEALADFDRARQISPGSVEITLLMAQVYGSQNQWDGVARILDAALQENPMEPDLLEKLGDAYVRAKQPNKAEQAWSRLFQLRPETYPHLVTLAESWIQSRNLEGAHSLAMKIKEHCFKIHQEEVIIQLLEGILQQSPHETEVLSQLAAIHLSLDNRGAYQQCLEDMFAGYLAVENYLVAGEVFDNLLSVNPVDPEHRKRLDLLRPKLPPESIRALESHLQKVKVYRRSGDSSALLEAGLPGGIDHHVPIPTSDRDILEDLFLQVELFLRFKMADRAEALMDKIENLIPLPEEYQRRYLDLCGGLSRFPASARVAAPAPLAPRPVKEPVAPSAAPPRITPLARLATSAIGHEIEYLAAIHRKIHAQQGTKSVLYTAVNELGRMLEVTRCFAALSSTARPITTYIEYSSPGRDKSNPDTLLKVLQFCETIMITHHQPVISDQVLNDPTFSQVHDEMQTQGVCSMILWPLVSENQVIGYLGVEQGDEPRAWTGEELLILQTVCEQVSVALMHANLLHLVKTLAIIDEDTGLIGRHSFFDCLVSEIERAQKQATPLSLVLVELRQVSEVEKEMGDLHAVQFQRDFARFIVSHTRELDTAVKFDRNVIALILPDTPFIESEWVIQKLQTLMVTEPSLECYLAPDDQIPQFWSASAEALVIADQGAADSATDVVFRAEQAFAQTRATIPATLPSSQNTARRR